MLVIKGSPETGLFTQSVELVDAGVLTTPALFYLTTQKNYFDCGIIITASHNLYHDNGIKIVDARNGKIGIDDELAITHYYYNHSVEINYDALGTERISHNAQEAYIQALLARFPTNFLKGKKIVLDCAHGAASTSAPLLFTRAGAQVIAINAQPTGKNINQQCGSTHPEGLQKAVAEHKSDYGFAFDGDGDRIIAVTSEGVVKDGDDIVALLSTHPDYSSQKIIVGTLMSNYGLQEYLTSKDKALIRAAVGDKWVSQELEKNNALLGGEQSGHIIMKDYLASGDGLYTALKICQTIELTHNYLMHTFEKYPQILINLPVKIKKDLSERSLARLIKDHTDQIIAGRLIVRYSGTEDLLRIMIEDKDTLQAHTIGNSLARVLAQELC